MTIIEARRICTEYYYKTNPSEEDSFLYTEALKFLIEEAKDADYMVELGGLYYESRQFDLALKYYELAAEYNNLYAISNLGYIWYYGRTGERNYEKAFYYFDKARQMGDIIAAYKVADMHKNGYFVEKDYGKYKEIIEGLYPKVKKARRLNEPLPEIFTRLAKIRSEEGNVKDALRLYDRAKDFLAQRIQTHSNKALDELEKNLTAEVKPSVTSVTHCSMIGFFHENEEYGCFSNWYHAEFDYAGQHYVNSEQFMMYHKVLMFRKYELADQIIQTNDPAKCKKIAGQKFPEFDSELWEKTCVAIVKRGVKAKFLQNRDILKILLNTGNAILAECSPYDKKWGIGIDINDPQRLVIANWKGKNLLGRILMEVREELRQELQNSPDGLIDYVEARELEPITEWNMTAGELKRIPQFYDAIHAYADTLKDYRVRNIFYNDFSLYQWEIAMRENMGGGLPVIGFYEMKQDVYDTVRRLQIQDVETRKRIAFCKKFIPVLQMIEEDEDLKIACKNHSAYTKDKNHPALISYLYDEFMHGAYQSDMVVTNYGELVKECGCEEWVAYPTDERLELLDASHILGCIAWHFRRDHFSEGSLIADSVAEGHMLRMLKCYVDKLEQ